MKVTSLFLAFFSTIIVNVAAIAFGSANPCNRDAGLEGWLTSHSSEWQKRLARLPGFENPGFLQICRVTGGGSRTDGRYIYLPPQTGDEEQLSVAHEYVHLALRHHPLSRDEAFVERMARALVMGEE